MLSYILTNSKKMIKQKRKEQWEEKINGNLENLIRIEFRVEHLS
jgi:hypothetical protein